MSTDHEDLLTRYLSLPEKLREEEFADTCQAAKITGLNRRTILYWIDMGSVRAVPVGRKYRVHLPSLRAHLKTEADKRGY